MRTGLFSGISTAVIVLAALPAMAGAQTAPSPAPAATTLGEVIVTAQRQETNLQRTPIAVTALSGEFLARQGATSLLDVQNSTPNLVVSSRSTAGTTQGGFSIRGIGVDATDSSAAVGIYVDGVYYPSGSGNLLGLFDIDRIEVLRGPQGTLFGRNTIAGAVQYISTKPSDVFGGYAETTLGDVDRREASAAVNIPVNDRLSIRIAARYDQEGGYVHDDLNDLDRGATTTKQARILLRWKPIDRVTVDLKGEVLTQRGNGRAISLLAVNSSLNPPGTPNPGASLVFAALQFGLNPASLATRQTSSKDFDFPGFNSPDDSEYDFHTGQGTITWDVADNMTLKSISAYSYSRSHIPVDVDDSPLPILAGDHGVQGTGLFTQELQLAGRTLGGKLHYTLGGYYYSSDDTTRGQLDIFGVSPQAIPQTGGDTRLRRTAEAAYGQLTYDITDRLSATVGLRYNHEDVDASYINTLVPVGPPTFGVVSAPPIPPAPTASFSNVTPAFGLDYKLTSNAFLYAKASEGFRAGGVSISAGLTQPLLDATFGPGKEKLLAPGYLPFNEETTWTYEGGARLQFLDHRLRINPTVFYTNWSNIQFNSFVYPVTGPLVITQNAGSARLFGGELESQFAVTSALRLNFSGSYLNSKYTSISPGVDVNLGDALQHAPKFKFDIGAQYTWSIAPGPVTVSGDYSWTDTQRSATSDNDFITQPSYGLLNARVTYQPRGTHLDLAVYATNLTDKFYYIGGTSGYTTFGSVEADIGRPREVGFTAKYHF